MKRIAVLYEDADCLVLNKPAGLPVQGGEGVGASLDRLLAAAWSPRPLLVHRLDKDTSGLILAAKHRESALRFSSLLARRREGKAVPWYAFSGDGAAKGYLAVCIGVPQPPAGRIPVNLTIRGVSKAAETRYALIAQGRLAGAAYALLELELGTGRTHQIRRHLAHIGHPIPGDGKYGSFALNRELRGSAGIKRLLLHAARLVIRDSRGGFFLDISAPPPDYFSRFLQTCGVLSAGPGLDTSLARYGILEYHEYR
ncbi:MAG: RluA family pseudouridine synthase [Treponema sp.]|nr:RluA family pseudouridine synthase [Treponema sp.]